MWAMTRLSHHLGYFAGKWFSHRLYLALLPGIKSDEYTYMLKGLR